jgi:hypothetical protein
MVLLVSVLGFSEVLPAHASTEAPPGAVVAEAKFPHLGARWVMKTTDQSGSTRTTTWTVMDEGAFEGKPVYRVTNGADVFLLEKPTRNLIARLKGDTPVFLMKPHEGQFTWPLWVGKRWTSSFDAKDLAQRRQFPDVTSEWSVETYEEIIVPAGTFKAFRLKSAPSRNQSVAYTLWYAPELGLLVKQIVERGATNYLGGGKATNELVEYELK